MRRMYSEQELTKIIKEVSEAYIDELIEDGVFDDKIVDAVNDYLDENPIVPGDLDFSSIDFVAKTINQVQANASVPVNISGSGGVPPTDIYSRIIVIHNVLYIIFNYKLTNNTGESKTLYTVGTINATLPNAIASKIFDFAGDDVATAKVSKCTIGLGKGYVADTLSGGITAEINIELFNTETANQMQVNLAKGSGGLTIANGDTKYITGRMILSLL